jgi:hypothetical protein
LERARSKKQKKEKDESSSFLNNKRVFSSNIDKNEVTLIKIDNVLPNKLFSKMKQFMKEVIY